MKTYIQLLFAACLFFVHSLSSQSTLHFAQFTDPHLFDAGYNCYGSDVASEHIQNLQAIQWAVDKINEANRADPLDFVVITGDFGLVNTTLPGKYEPPRERPSRDACSGQQASHQFGPVKPVSVSEAADRVARILGRLDVNRIYLVPGNNDVPYNDRLKTEDPLNRDLYRSFVTALSGEMSGRVQDLTNQTPEEWTSPPLTVNGYSLIGMDTASFKPSTIEISTSRPANFENSNDVSHWPECPAPYVGTVAEARRDELERVAKLVERYDRPFLIFTHVPDLMDPYKDRQYSQTNHCHFPSSWFLEPISQRIWTDIGTDPNMVALFAGHFHDSLSGNYGRLLPSASAPYKKNVMIAPPLSIKNQWRQEPSRGLLIVRVKGRTVSAETDWFRGALQSSAPAKASHSAESSMRMFWVTRWPSITLYLLAAGLVLWTDLKLRELQRARASKP